MDIFSFDSYKKYVLARVESLPRKGHGQFIKIARHLRVSPVIVSQVLKGSRNFSEEQALQLAGYLGLPPADTEYFMRLVALEKAGTEDLKNFHTEAIQSLKKRALEVKNRIPEHHELDEAARSIFYSDWTYTAVHLLTSIPKSQTPDVIADRLGLPLARTNEIIEFLLSAGLCKREEAGKVGLGIASTHVDAQSRFVNSHRRNWRLKALEGLNHAKQDELFYAAPCTLSREDFDILKRELLTVITALVQRVRKTKPEVLACLNIDWFKI